MGVIILLLFLAFIGWAIFTQVAARQQLTIACPAGAATARELVAGSFGAAWSRVDGRGIDNFRPRLRYRPPVISVSYLAAESGACEVHIWCSAFSTKYGAMNHAQLVWRKKAALARQLSSAAGHPQAGAGPVPGVVEPAGENAGQRP
jgi:hypothetical protein